MPRAIALVLVIACLVWSDSSSAQTEPTLKDVQQVLIEQGFDPGPVDGVMGRQTRSALRAYQQAAGLPASGEPDMATLDRLFARSAPALGSAPMTKAGKRRSDTLAEKRSLSPPSTGTQSRIPRSNPVTRDSSRAEGISIWWWVGLAVVLVVFFRLRQRKKKIPAANLGRQSNPTPGRNTGNVASVTIDLDDMDWAPTRARAKSPSAYRSEGDRCWVRPGSAVEIAGHRIPDGMVYVGNRLPDQHGYRNENCLIDPTLAVASGRADDAGEFMDYWPSYGSIRPSSRLAFLRWLSGDRSDPDAYIGYVFVFLYGLERRLVLEQVAEEAPRLIAELRRLHSVYGANRSFSRYALALIDAAAVIFGDAGLSDEPSFDHGGYDVPLRVKAAIARQARDGEGVSADWMLAWVLTDPETRLGTPARRDFEAFRSLFGARFAARYPMGMPIKTSAKRPLRDIYRSASGTFEVSLDEHLKDLPDISRISRPLADSRALAVECVEELDRYSRFLGRRPDDRNSLEALSLLPLEIRSSRLADIGDEALRWLHDVLANGATLPLETVFTRIRGAAPAKLTQRDVKLIADALGRFGIGLSPDPRFAFKAPRLDDDVVLFRLPEPIDELEGATDAYRATLLTLNLGMLIAQADGTVSAEEEASLAALVARAPALTNVERVRLKANIEWMRSKPLTLGQLRARLKDAGSDDRQTMGKIAIAVAGADGRIDPSEVRLLEKLYTALELDQSQLYGDLNNLGATDHGAPGDVGPVRVQPGDDRPTGFAIPGQPKPEEPPTEAVVALDRSRIDAIMADTARVAGVLGDVFADEEAEEIEPEHLEPADGPFQGLDKRQGAFLSELLTRESWPREEFEKLARSFDLMADGAMEALNEWAIETFDEMVIEDGDTITVDKGVLEMGA